MIEFEGERIQGTNFVVPTRDPKDIVTNLPPGLLGDPMAVPRCALVDFTRGGDCPVASQVGIAEVAFATSVLIEPIYDLCRNRVSLLSSVRSVVSRSTLWPHDP